MNEASKAVARLKSEGNFDNWIVAPILDIGAGGDLVVPEARGWDVGDGDAQMLEGLADEGFATVFSSHCLEHLRDPVEAFANWWRVLRPGGCLVVLVPDADLYEQGYWPSAFNPDHKWTFTLDTDRPWSPRNINITNLLRYLPGRMVESLRRVGAADSNNNENDGPIDQTDGPGESSIELVVRKLVRPLALHTTLDRLYLCPNCHQQRLTVLGADGAGVVQLRCESCGAVGNL